MKADSHSFTVWPASSWPDVAGGTITYADDSTDTIGSPVVLEHCDLGVPLVDLTDDALLPPDIWNGTWLQMDIKWRESRHADAVMKLQVGGKAKSRRQNLVVFNGSATQIVPVRDPFYHNPNQFVQNIPVPPQSIKVVGNKTLGSDGNLYVVLPDGDEEIVTPTVDGVNDYTFGLTAGKYTPIIAARGNDINYDDISVTNPEFCVGQQLTFWMNWNPPNVANANYWWHLPDKFVNQATNYSASCTTYVKNTDLLTNATQQCWYVRDPGGACSVREILQFSNGQSVNIAAAGTFTIYRPTATVDVEHAGAVSLDGNFYLQDAPVDFYGHVQSTYHGYANWTQIINRDLQEAFYVENPTYAQDWLDTYTFYANQNSPEVGPGLDKQIPLNDAPEVLIDVHVSNIDKFKTYLMFKPDGDGSIYVTLGRTDWGWNGDAFSRIAARWWDNRSAKHANG